MYENQSQIGQQVCVPEKIENHIAIDNEIEYLDNLRTALIRLRERIQGNASEMNAQTSPPKEVPSLNTLLCSGAARIADYNAQCMEIINDIESNLF